ncbi:hypothetical protein KI387_038061, partial [Taxus chinensis]
GEMDENGKRMKEEIERRKKRNYEGRGKCEKEERKEEKHIQNEQKGRGEVAEQRRSGQKNTGRRMKESCHYEEDQGKEYGTDRMEIHVKAGMIKRQDNAEDPGYRWGSKEET